MLKHQFFPASSEPVAKTLAASRPATGRVGAIWQSVLWFFLEGFALYGASLHWVATTAVTAIASEVDAQQRQKPARDERQKSVSLVSPAASVERQAATDRTGFGMGMPSFRDGFASPAREVDRYRFVQPGWLVVIWRGIANRWARWRREREIKTAVAALAEHDDRMLRDMGIPNRSQIEQVVRYGRDY
jgi:uncharacterized protein YjiS (DUF1127 family)